VQEMLSIETVWSEKMSIGIELLDDHHKTMVRLMLETKAEAEGARHSEDIRSILSALVGYSKYHFLSEERIMFENHFPRLEEQRADHKWFVERLDEIIAAYTLHDGVFKQELFEYLKGWFVDHILTKDMLLKGKLNNDG
jgi:hemerythrin-like metal-binding protein